MLINVGRLAEVIRLPFGVVNVQKEEPAISEDEELLEEEEQTERFSIGGYRATELPGTQDELLLELQKRGYALSEPPEGGGGGLLVTRGKIVVDANGAGASGRDDSGKAFGVGQGSLNLGYIVARNRWIRIYPLLGVGGGGAGASRARAETEGGAAEAADSQGSPGYGMFLAGVGIDLTLKFGRASPFAGVRLGVGIRIGPTGVLPKPFLRFISGTSLRA